MRYKIVYTNFILLQLFLFLFLSYNYIANVFRVNSPIIILIMLIVTMLSIYLFYQLCSLLAKQMQAEKERIKYQEAEKLINSFRAKHHDFVNHLQVIMGLTQMKRNTEVINYVKELSKDLIQIEKLVNLKRPEIAVLISTKIASLSYLQADIDVTTSLENLQIAPDKLVGIFGNLLDNALYEIESQKEKWLKIKVYEEEGWYYFEITNPGSIPDDVLQKMFQAGFTTKGDQGSGMGLYIVQDLVQGNGGSIQVESQENKTKFTIKLPNTSLSRAIV
ncbi:Spo0B domain-containing protein [Bacillota bacterium LX-D]|nr:Spo0B domain-containing protein [Bacillota bacterium LX-D]